jgi:uncharacterized protein (DUF1800 family)
VVHLRRRAGFAATWDELQRDLADGPGPSIERLLAGGSRSRGVPEGFEQTAATLANTAVASRDPARLKAWWFYRMLFGPDPLGEKLTLLWHNHFATSNLKVDDLAAMHRQNNLFRELARAPFGQLLDRAVRDPALLLWLDAPANRKSHPNENLARELMELFTLGLGHYSERDVKEAARALTGWTLVEERFQEVPAKHDAGEKIILGRRGPWTGADLIRMLREHPATAERLARRLCELFMGEGAVDAGGVNALAAGLRAHDLDIAWAVTTVLGSRGFFAETNLRTRVLGPVEYIVGAARALELFEPPPSTLMLADWAARLGQDLFYPPNVGGWPGGRSWISTQTMIGRANFAAALPGGVLTKGKAVDLAALARRHGQDDDPEAVLSFTARLLLGAPETAYRSVAQLLASPAAQLG